MSSTARDDQNSSGFDTDQNTDDLTHESSPLLQKTTPSRPWYRTPSPYWLLIGLFFVALTWGIGSVIRVQIYIKIVCRLYYSSQQTPSAMLAFYNGWQVFNNKESLEDFPPNENCNIPEVQALTSQMMLVLNLCGALPAIFVLGALGSLSDRKGRRVVLLMSLAGLTFSIAVLLVVARYDQYIDPHLLVIGPLVEGFSGGLFSLLSTSQAYISDCTTAERRSIIFGWLQGTLLLGLSVGPLIGGWIVKATNSLLSVFYISIVIFGFFFLYLLFVVPESLSLEKRAANAKEQRDKQRELSLKYTKWWQKYNVFEPLAILLPNNSVLFPKKEFKNDKPIGGKYLFLNLVIINGIVAAAIWGINAIFILYTTLKFNWDALEQGYFLFLMFGSRVLMLIFVLPLLSKIFKKSDMKGKRNQLPNPMAIVTPDGDSISPVPVQVIEDFDDSHKRRALKFDIWIIRISLISETFQLIGYGMVQTGIGFTCLSGIGAFSAVLSPTLKSLMTKLVPASQIGQLLGALAVVESSMRFLSPLIMNGLYSIMVTSNPSTIWYFIGFLVSIGCVLSFGIGSQENRKDQDKLNYQEIGRIVA
ncbi:hypothetical protein G9A89_017851 [Geosiphon pyriformis]|nr:hypothetical protein G9A89_017851 [Geosiphon pyriformis]